MNPADTTCSLLLFLFLVSFLEVRVGIFVCSGFVHWVAVEKIQVISLPSVNGDRPDLI